MSSEFELFEALKYTIVTTDYAVLYYNSQGEFHRDNDLPAVIQLNGNRARHWYQNGLLHRDNDLPAIIFDDGSKYWFQHGQRHRENGPAVVRPNSREEYWFLFGELIK